MKKIDFYGPIKEELGVVMAFSKIHEILGFSKLVPSSAKGFDIESIDYNGNDVTLEFEYLSSNFIAHGHQNQMEDKKKYVIVCWEDDCSIKTLLMNKYKRTIYEVIEVRKYVNIKKDLLPPNKTEDPKYVILSYNPYNADCLDFGEWSFSNCYRVTTSSRTPKFAGDSLPPGSKILFYHKGYIIGGCTVVRYEVIDEPQTEREWELYSKLTNYPITLFNMNVEEIKKDYSRGHIFYIDFFDIRDFKINLLNYVKKRMPHQGKINLSKEEYYRIIGH